jgi:hypothetical protein
VRLLKLSIVPAVLLFSVVMAAPAFAHQLTKAVFTQAQCQDGRICVTLSGNIEPGTQERHVFVDIFAQGSNQSLGEIKFTVPKNSGTSPIQMPADTECFKVIQGSSFTLEVVKVTTSDDTTPGDLTIEIPSTHQTIVFKGDGTDEPVAIEDLTLTQCVATSSPSPSPSASASAATTTTTLANTGGFDFRFPLIGLILLVAGGTLYVIGASRGRSTTK